MFCKVGKVDRKIMKDCKKFRKIKKIIDGKNDVVNLKVRYTQLKVNDYKNIKSNTVSLENISINTLVLIEPSWN